MQSSFRKHLLQLASGTSLVTALLGQPHLANASPLFRPIIQNALISAAGSNGRKEQEIAPLLLEPSRHGDFVLVGHRSHSSHKSHSSHVSSHSGSSGSYSPSYSNNSGNYATGSGGSGLAGNSGQNLVSPPPRVEPAPRESKKIQRPPGYKELDLPAKVYVARIDVRPNGVVVAQLEDLKTNRKSEIMQFDDFNGWTVSDIDVKFTAIA